MGVVNEVINQRGDLKRKISPFQQGLLVGCTLMVEQVHHYNNVYYSV